LTSIDEFYTEKGRELQAEMDGYAKTFNLSFTFGTAPQSYYLNRYPMNHQKSLIKLYADKVFNTVVVEGRRKKAHQHAEVSVEQTLVDEEKERKKKPAFLFNTGGARFDIFKGPFTRDDQFTVIPFDNEIWAVEKELDYDLVIDVVAWLNNLWGEPELLSLNSKIDGIVKRQNEIVG
jgi:hypothetical protein